MLALAGRPYFLVSVKKEGFQWDGAVFLGGQFADTPQTECVKIAEPCSANKEPYCESKNSVAGLVSSLKVFHQYLLTTVSSGGQTESANPPSGDGVTLFGNYDFNEQDKSGRNQGDQYHCGPINATTDTTHALYNGKPLWVDGSKDFGETIGSGNNQTTVSCNRVLISIYSLGKRK